MVRGDFWDRLDRSGECWLWTGAKDPNGYGVELLYELPREMWERDIDAGLNYLKLLPTEGPEALVDDLENAPSFGTAAE